MRLVLDTDVELSGLRSTTGASRVLLLAIKARAVTPLVSVAMVVECEAVLKRLDHFAASHLDTDDIDTFLDALIMHASHVVPHFTYRPSIQDPDDEIFVSASQRPSRRNRHLQRSGRRSTQPPRNGLWHPNFPPRRHPQEAHMATISNFALRLPPSLIGDVKALAAQDAVSVNQFVVQATAEKRRP